MVKMCFSYMPTNTRPGLFVIDRSSGRRLQDQYECFQCGKCCMRVRNLCVNDPDNIESSTHALIIFGLESVKRLMGVIIHLNVIGFDSYTSDTPWS